MSYVLLPTTAVIVCMDTLNVYPRMKTVHCMHVYIGVCNGPDISADSVCM